MCGNVTYVQLSNSIRARARDLRAADAQETLASRPILPSPHLRLTRLHHGPARAAHPQRRVRRPDPRVGSRASRFAAATARICDRTDAPELVDLGLELLNLDIPFGEQATGLGQQGLQEFDIVRKIGAV